MISQPLRTTLPSGRWLRLLDHTKRNLARLFSILRVVGVFRFTIRQDSLNKLLVLEFTLNDRRHLEAAEGWLGLGDWEEANEELENITPSLRVHPEVLGVRFQIYALAEKWECGVEVARAISELMPDNPFGHFHLAFSLHELKERKKHTTF